MITPTIDKLIHANYNPVITKVSESLDSWSSLPVSLIGRINIIKMNIIPKFLYLFRSIPLPPPSGFFPNMNTKFTKCIWKKRRARLRLTLLYLPYERGGLRLPNLQWYYWSAQLANATYWFSLQPQLPWVQVESMTAKNMNMALYLYSDLYKNLKKDMNYPFVKNTLIVWNEAQRTLGKVPDLSYFAPIWGKMILALNIGH